MGPAPSLTGVATHGDVGDFLTTPERAPDLPPLVRADIGLSIPSLTGEVVVGSTLGAARVDGGAARDQTVSKASIAALATPGWTPHTSWAPMHTGSCFVPAAME